MREYATFRGRIQVCAKLRALFDAPVEWVALAQAALRVLEDMFLELIGERAPEMSLETTAEPALAFCPSMAFGRG